MIAVIGRVAVLFAVVLGVFGCDAVAGGEADPTSSGETKLSSLAKIEDKRVTESSGIAPSYRVPGQYFTHNDSGDKARFFRFDRKGKVLADYSVRNAEAVDWEDMASAKLDGKPYVFLGDIGDNAGKRKSIFVYRVPEPTGGDSAVEADETYELVYPDVPHNAETLMVNGLSGEIYVVTKAATRPSMVFKFKPGRSGKYTLKKVGELTLGAMIRESKLITGGDISPDAKHVVLRTYMSGYEFDAGREFDDWVKASPRTVKTNLEFQGEAICYSADGKSILTTSEGTPCPVSEGVIQR